jgi:hypothetical protein
MGGCESASPEEKRARTGRDPGWRESAIQRLQHPRKVVRRSRNRGCNGHRILRRVLTDGRHPGPFEASLFTRRRGRGLGGFLTTPIRPRDREETRAERPRRWATARGKRERRQGCQRLGRIERRGKKTPTHVPLQALGGNLRNGGNARSDTIRRSGRGRRENVPSPGHAMRSRRLRGASHAAKAARANRECARCGCTHVVRVAEVGRTHRASSAPGGRKTSRGQQRALARRKPESTA